MTTLSFLSHYVCWEKGVYRLQLLHADTHSHTVTVEPYEKECAGTRFCDGLLLAANTSFEREKNALIARLKEEGLFTMDEVVEGITQKMIRRHPHVFGDAVVSGSGEVLTKWDEIKKQEKAGKEWTEAYLPAAFNEAKELIDAAAERKGFGKKERNDQSE